MSPNGYDTVHKFRVLYAVEISPDILFEYAFKEDALDLRDMLLSDIQCCNGFSERLRVTMIEKEAEVLETLEAKELMSVVLGIERAERADGYDIDTRDGRVVIPVHVTVDADALHSLVNKERGDEQEEIEK